MASFEINYHDKHDRHQTYCVAEAHDVAMDIGLHDLINGTDSTTKLLEGLKGLTEQPNDNEYEGV
jgi:hypothetical protein